MSYLANNDESLDTLHLFLSVKLICMRYNKALSFSAAVESLFSIALDLGLLPIHNETD